MKKQILIYVLLTFWGSLTYSQTWQWAKSAHGAFDDWGTSVAMDASGNTFFTGSFFSPSVSFGTTTLTNAGISDIFLAKYGAGGNLVWAQRIGGTEGDGGLSVAADAAGDAVITGWFRDICSFGSTTLTNVDPLFGGSDLFVARLSGTIGLTGTDNLVNFSIFPNPASGIVTINTQNSADDELEISVFNISGKLALTEMLRHNNRQINIGNLSNGVYPAAIKSKDLMVYRKLVIQR